MKDLDIKFDLNFLAKAKERVKIPPKLMCYTVYLSEIIGYYRYITIYDHLEANPEKRFHPIFKWFGRWCSDEHRHGHFFAAVMKANSKSMLKGPINHQLIKFFTLSVYMTMYLRDVKPKSQVFYRAMGLEPRDYDLHVIRRCDEEASTVWGFKLPTQKPAFIKNLERMAKNNEKLEELQGQKGIGATLKRLQLKAGNIASIARLFVMRTEKVS
jgi:magnesium-protoporphyrin IX monomethyl ester (oxidative) cyclase